MPDFTVAKPRGAAEGLSEVVVATCTGVVAGMSEDTVATTREFPDDIPAVETVVAAPTQLDWRILTRSPWTVNLNKRQIFIIFIERRIVTHKSKINF
jgi:hypothetical protein